MSDDEHAGPHHVGRATHRRGRAPRRRCAARPASARPRRRRPTTAPSTVAVVPATCTWSPARTTRQYPTVASHGLSDPNRSMSAPMLRIVTGAASGRGEVRVSAGWPRVVRGGRQPTFLVEPHDHRSDRGRRDELVQCTCGRIAELGGRVLPGTVLPQPDLEPRRAERRDERLAEVLGDDLARIHPPNLRVTFRRAERASLAGWRTGPRRSATRSRTMRRGATLVCRTHGVTGGFAVDAWTAPVRTPPLYPDAVVLRPDVGPEVGARPHRRGSGRVGEGQLRDARPRTVRVPRPVRRDMDRALDDERNADR